MTRPRLSALFAHLTLALAGVCLTLAETPFLPEMQLLLVPYLLLIGLSWRQAGRWMLSDRAANLLGLACTAAALGWAAFRLRSHDGDLWHQDIPLTAAIIPYLGPVLMTLQLVRLFRPRSHDDFWLLQGLGLLQVALGCVLASGTLFGGCLATYLVVGLCAMAAHERQRQGWRQGVVAAEVSGAPSLGVGLREWLPFSLRWAAGVAALGLPLFLVTPRLDGPEWDPFARFGVRPQQTQAVRTGFSDEIDLRRTGSLVPDDTPAFWVTVTDHDGNPAALPPDQRWRGMVFDRYQDGIWRSEVNWQSGASSHRPLPVDPGTLPHDLRLVYRVPGRSGGLFLADPVRLGPRPGEVPVQIATRRPRHVPLFFEAGGTVVPLTYLTGAEYVYTQYVQRISSRRWPAVRVRDAYQRRLLGLPPRLYSGPESDLDLEEWTRGLLLRSVPAGATRLRAAVTETPPGDPLPPAVWAEVGQRLADHLALSGEFSYSLALRRTQPSLDPVADFLLHVRQGPCERYAAALTLMLRSVGVPARVVKGYRGAESTGEPDSYLVRQSHAHAWVEAYVPAASGDPEAFDWLSFDPTPGTEPAASLGLLAWLQQQGRSGQTLWRDMILGYNAQQQEEMIHRRALRLLTAAAPWASAALGTAAVAWLIRRWWRRRRPRAPAVGFGLYDRLTGLLAAHLLLPPRLDRTPRELADEAQGQLHRQPATAAVADVPARVVEVYYRARFGGQPPPESQLVELTGQLNRLEAALKGTPP